MADLMEYVEVLADQIGPRPVSTEEEHQASMYIAQELSEEGLDVSVDEFATPSGVRWPYVIAYVASVLGTVISGIGIFVPGISLSMFIIGLILVLGGLFIYITENNNQPILSKMRASGVSQNVVAKHIPENLAREARRRKIIIVAHVDTVRVQPEASPKIIGYIPILYKILMYCMIGLAGALFIRLLPLPWPEVIDNILWGISLVASLYVLVAAGCIIASHFTPYISGGNDNASSIAVLLSVAHMLANPNERSRYSRKRASSFDFGIGAEDYDDYVGSNVESMDFDDEGDLVMHSAEEAEDLNLDYMSEGGELTYDDDGYREDATVAYSSLSPERQLDILTDTAAEELHYDAMATGTFSLDDVELDGVDGVVAQPNPNSIADINVPDLDFNLDEDIEQARKEPAERVEDSVVFADYIESEPKEASQSDADGPIDVEGLVVTQVDVDEEPAEEAEPEFEEEAEITAQEEAEEEPPAPAPVYMPIETPTRARAEENPQVARPVPSWYAAAKEKAAKDLERKAQRSTNTDDSALSYRSRFADSPAIIQNEHRDEEPEKEEAQVVIEQPVAEQPVAEDLVVTEVVDVEATEAPAVSEESEAVYPVEEVLEVKEQDEAIDLDISDDELDELNPDATGLFAPLEEEEEVRLEGRQESRKPITSRIPNIGSSDDRIRAERKSARESRAARGTRTELQGIPDVNDDGFAILESGLEFMDEDAYEAAAAAEVVEPVVPAIKSGRKKPTARHVTQQFVPTRASHRDIQLGGDRQEAPVSSTYESTPQAASAQDPFSPKTEDPAGDYMSARPVVRQRSEYASSYAQSSETVVSPANTSSFPALTGSFPALSGAMPTIDASDFAGSSAAPVADDAALDSFMSNEQAPEINVPDSRFRSAFDKVGGLFNRKGKDSRADNPVDAPTDWNEEDDYGWKGGGYIEDEAESAFDAVRQRAAQIRESVVSMTERDLLDKEVWFVALGASGAGAQGMKNFLDLHSSELRGSLIINLEAVGAGAISFVELEGTGKPRRADRRLMTLVKKASKEIRGTEMKPCTLEWRNTDATPAMIAGMRALTLMGIADNDVAPVDWHTAEDTAAIVEEDKLEFMTDLLLKVIENS